MQTVSYENAKAKLQKAIGDMESALAHYDSAVEQNDFTYVDECLGFAINTLEDAGWDVDALRDIG